MAEDSTSLPGNNPGDSTIPDTTQPNFLDGVTNAIGLIAGLSALGATANSLSDIFSTLTAPKNFIVPDLANNGSSAIGFKNASGGIFGTSHMVNTIDPRTDEALGQANVTPGTWKALDFMINRALGMDWVTKNADPGNPNILEAYRFAGRNFTQDGGTGQFTWAAAFATWILVKSGFSGLRTMSPIAFERYGNPVKFHKGPLTEVRKWDILVFSSNVNIHHVGFIKSYDPTTQTLEIVGGDQADKVKITKMPFSITNPQFRVTHVRRNWQIPTDVDTSIIVKNLTRTPTNMPTPAGVTPIAPLDEITVQPLPPLGATPAEIAEFNNRYPPVPTTDPKAQFGPYRTALGRPSVEDITGLAGAAIGRAENAGPAPTRPRNPRVR